MIIFITNYFTSNNHVVSQGVPMLNADVLNTNGTTECVVQTPATYNFTVRQAVLSFLGGLEILPLDVNYPDKLLVHIDKLRTPLNISEPIVY